MLTDAGGTVDKGICDLPTAFVARVGSGPLHRALCAEYDCLPGIGHACGHNLIAAMATGAEIALPALVSSRLPPILALDSGGKYRHRIAHYRIVRFAI